MDGRILKLIKISIELNLRFNCLSKTCLVDFKNIKEEFYANTSNTSNHSRPPNAYKDRCFREV